MEPHEPQFDPDHNSEIFQSIVERMARAKWITGTNLVRPEQFWISLTELGCQRIGKASDALIKLAPGLFKAENISTLTADSIKQPTPADLCLMLLEVMPVMAELQPPPFSPEEEDTIIAMLEWFALAKGKVQIPPSRR